MRAVISCGISYEILYKPLRKKNGLNSVKLVFQYPGTIMFKIIGALTKTFEDLVKKSLKKLL